MEQIASRASSRSLPGAVLRVWREEGWPGVLWRLKARLGWLGLHPAGNRLPPLRRPDWIEVAGSGEGLARDIALPAIEEPLVSVILHGPGPVEDSLCSIAAIGRHLPEAPVEVIVVGGGSDDDGSRLLALVENLVYLANDTRKGFAHSMNRAARSARGRFLLFVDDAVQVQPGWVDELVAALEDPEVGMAGSKVIARTGRLEEAWGGLRSDGRVERIGLGEDPRLPEYNLERTVDYCSSASVIVRRDHFLAEGGFDEAVGPCHLEDLSLRLRSRGLSVVYAPRSVVVRDPVNGLAHGTRPASIEVSQGLRDRWGETIAREERVRAIAFYLPQYHPIPENDSWWGKGFTEWTNVARAKPLYRGHAQPRVPADLGFYDLRLPEAREAQAALAAGHGLSRVLLLLLLVPRPASPRAAARRRARAETARLPVLHLLGQRELDAPVGRSRGGSPHRAGALRRRTTGGSSRASFRSSKTSATYASTDGRCSSCIGRASCPISSGRRPSGGRWRGGGPGRPLPRGGPELRHGGDRPEDLGLRRRGRVPAPRVRGGGEAAVGWPAPRAGSSTIRRAHRASAPARCRLPALPHRHALAGTTVPGESTRAHIFVNDSPEAYERWLRAIVRQTRRLKRRDERIVFINAWNEWAEGNYLEPDLDRGRSYLEATARALDVSDD